MTEDKKTEFRLHKQHRNGEEERRTKREASDEGREEESTGHSLNEENEAPLLLPGLYSCTLDPRSNGVEPTIIFIR